MDEKVSPNEQLLTASKDGVLSGVRNALDLGANIDTREHETLNTALILAIDQKRTGVIKLLLGLTDDPLVVIPANIFLKNKDGETAETHAKRLVKTENQFDDDGARKINNIIQDMIVDIGCIFDAIESRRRSHEIKDLFNKRMCLTKTRNQNGQTPLMIAVFHKYYGVVHELLEVTTHRVIDAVDDGYSLALESGSFETVISLLNYSSPPSIFPSQAEKCSNEFGHEELSNYLVKLSRNVNSVIPQLVERGKIKELDVLNILPDEVDTELASQGYLLKPFNIRDQNGKTPLHHAVKNGRKNVVEFLLGHDVTINIKDQNGKTPADIAKDEGYNEIWNLLENNLDGDDFYKMNKSGVRGIAFLVGNGADGSKQKEVAHACEGDLKSMEEVLRATGYDVEVHQNLSADGILQKLREVKTKIKESHDSFLFYFSGHGYANMLCGQHLDDVVNVNDIFAEFDNLSCEILCGKPKIFLLDCCRDIPDEHLMDAFKCPSLPDFFVSHATTPDRKAYVDQENGGLSLWTYFLRSRLSENKECLTTILNSVRRDMDTKSGIQYPIDNSQTRKTIRWRPAKMSFT